jgi:hypothetical protein
MHKSATKCNETLGKWCKNKHGASKIIDTLETYQRRSGQWTLMHARRPGGTYAATPGNIALQGAAEMTRTTQGCKADNEFTCGGGCQTRQEMWVSVVATQWENFSAAAQSGDGEGCGSGGRVVARLGRWWAHD